MSVLDGIQLGKLKLTPTGFSGSDVAIRLEAEVGDELPDGSKPLAAVRDARDADTVEGEQVQPATPVLPIPVWESLQSVAWELQQARSRQ